MGELQFFHFAGQFGLLALLFSRGNLFAQTAGMFAVKSALNCRRDRLLAEIVGQHGGPRHRLEQGPMRVRRREKRGNEKDLAKPDEHDGILAPAGWRVNPRSTAGAG
jgi:hypothetical protein